MKLCINCKYYIPTNDWKPAMCSYIKFLSKVDGIPAVSASNCRNFHFMCGDEGIYWEEKLKIKTNE